MTMSMVHILAKWLKSANLLCCQWAWWHCFFCICSVYRWRKCQKGNYCWLCTEDGSGCVYTQISPCLQCLRSQTMVASPTGVVPPTAQHVALLSVDRGRYCIYITQRSQHWNCKLVSNSQQYPNCLIYFRQGWSGPTCSPRSVTSHLPGRLHRCDWGHRHEEAAVPLGTFAHRLLHLCLQRWPLHRFWPVDLHGLQGEREPQSDHTTQTLLTEWVYSTSSLCSAPCKAWGEKGTHV